MFLAGVSIQRNWSTVRGWLVGRAHWWGLGYILLCVVAQWQRVDTGGNNMSPVYLLPLAGLIVSLAISAPQLSDRICGTTMFLTAVSDGSSVSAAYARRP